MKLLSKIIFLLPFLMPLPGSGDELSAKDLRTLLALPGPHPVLIDIRPTEAFRKGSLPGAINIPGQVLLEKKLKFSRGCILISDGLADKVAPGPLADKLLLKGVYPVHHLKGGIAAWSELKDAPTTSGAGSSPGRTTRNVTYQDLARKTGDVCFIDLRTAEEREVPEGHECPVAEFCTTRRFGYCPDLKDFHVRNRRESREERAGETPLIVVIPGKTNDGEAVLNSLLVEGYRRSVILIGGAEVIATKGTRGLKRAGASTVRHRNPSDGPTPGKDPGSDK